LILVVGSGRLGNQLFQLANIYRLTKKPTEIVFSLGLGAALTVTKKNRKIYNTDNPIIYRIFDVVVRRLIEFLVRIEVVEHINDSITERRSRFTLLTYVTGYFQAERYVPEGFYTNIRDRKAKVEAEDLIIEYAENRIPIFIHVRRDDYPESWCLPSTYYIKAISLLEREIGLESVQIFILGVGNLENMEVFERLPHKTFSRLRPLADLFLMSLCSGGIISNSSFAWWGGCLCKRFLPVYAPKYWLGWDKGIWVPNDGISCKFKFIEVN